MARFDRECSTNRSNFGPVRWNQVSSTGLADGGRQLVARSTVPFIHGLGISLITVSGIGVFLRYPPLPPPRHRFVSF